MQGSMQKLDRLTSIRGFAALFVLVYHGQEMIGGFDLKPYTALFTKGYLAVDFFFVLSGFILAYVYASEFDRGQGRYLRFLNNRLARMYPVHVATLAITVLSLTPLSSFTHLPDVRHVPDTIVYSLLLIHGWGFTDPLAWNFPSWSISSEWFAYLCFPVLSAATRPFSNRARPAIIMALIWIAALAMFVLVLQRGAFGLHAPATAKPEAPFNNIGASSLIRVVCEFSAGVLLYRAYTALSGYRGSLDRLAALCMVALVVMLHVRWPGHWVLEDALAVSLTAILIFLVALSRGRVARALEHKWLVYLGEISYCIYMTHAIVLMFYQRLHRVGAPNPSTLLGGSLLFLLFLAVTVLASIAMHEWVEKPARVFVRQLTERPRVA
jgi:peptidoglycan/LPS O-acetylase OafA/YrhL